MAGKIFGDRVRVQLPMQFWLSLVIAAAGVIWWAANLTRDVDYLRGDVARIQRALGIMAPELRMANSE